MWTYPNTGDPSYEGRKTAKLYEQKTIATSASCNYNKFMEKAFVSSDELGFGYSRGCSVHALLVL